MSGATNAFRQAVGSLADQWLAAGLPSRQNLVEQSEKLDRLREHLKAEGIWEHPPCMLTATLDDGLGQGLAIIEKYALAMGMRLISLGLMQTPQAILDACLRHQPDYLGLTVLQFDTADDLRVIAENLPRKTRIVAGGPVFADDSDFAGRTGVHHSAKNVAVFLRLMLDTAC
jgi:methylmalonyl-CoA mutase cobalamin-binding subunit